MASTKNSYFAFFAIFIGIAEIVCKASIALNTSLKPINVMAEEKFKRE
jgi:hypothetical protein